MALVEISTNVKLSEQQLDQITDNVVGTITKILETPDNLVAVKISEAHIQYGTAKVPSTLVKVSATDFGKEAKINRNTITESLTLALKDVIGSTPCKTFVQFQNVTKCHWGHKKALLSGI